MINRDASELEISTLLKAVYQKYGYDFSQYSQAHVRRRIMNRMAISRDNLIGTNFSDYFSDLHNAEDGCQHVFSKGILIGYPLTFINKKKTNVLFNGSVYNDDNGKVLGAVMVAREVSV
ncbi:MAG: hypothetical protein RI883_769 [Bacteroidota bacterium]|jgi:chemotaxis methyl-accepting protein methylase